MINLKYYWHLLCIRETQASWILLLFRVYLQRIAQGLIYTVKTCKLQINNLMLIHEHIKDWIHYKSERGFCSHSNLTMCTKFISLKRLLAFSLLLWHFSISIYVLYSKDQGFILGSLQHSIATKLLKDQSKGQKETLRTPPPPILLTLTQQVCCGLLSHKVVCLEKGPSLYRTLVQYLSTFNTFLLKMHTHKKVHCSIFF